MNAIGQDSRRFISDSSIGIVGSALSAGISMLWVSCMGRMLGPVDYGTIGALLAMSYVVALLLGPLESAATKAAAQAHAEKADDTLAHVMLATSRRWGVPIGIALFGWLMISVVVRDALLITDTRPVVLTGVLWCTWVFQAIARGALIGAQRFTVNAVSLFIESVVRLLAGAAMLKLGFGVIGALFGYIVGVLASIACCLWAVRKAQRPADLKSLATPRLSYESFIFAYMFLAFCTNADVMVAKRTLLPSQAGLYAGAATFARMIYVAITPVHQALLSHVSRAQAQGQDVRRLFLVSTCTVAALLGVSVLVPVLGGEWLLSRIFGDAFGDGAQALVIMWISMSIVALETTFALALIGAERTRGMVLLLLPCLFEAVLLSQFHDSMEQIALCALAGALLGLPAFGLIYWSSRPRV